MGVGAGAVGRPAPANGEGSRHLGLLEGVAGVELDALARAQVEFERRQHVRMVAAMQAETGLQFERVSQVQSLALVARDRLVTADRALQQRVPALLDVWVTILDPGQAGNRGRRRGGPGQLRVEGNVAHDPAAGRCGE